MRRVGCCRGMSVRLLNKSYCLNIQIKNTGNPFLEDSGIFYFGGSEYTIQDKRNAPVMKN